MFSFRSAFSTFSFVRTYTCTARNALVNSRVACTARLRAMLVHEHLQINPRAVLLVWRVRVCDLV